MVGWVGGRRLKRGRAGRERQRRVGWTTHATQPSPDPPTHPPRHHHTHAGHYLPAIATYLALNVPSIPLGGVAMGSPFTAAAPAYASYIAYATNPPPSVAAKLLTPAAGAAAASALGACQLQAAACAVLDESACPAAGDACDSAVYYTITEPATNPAWAWNATHARNVYRVTVRGGAWGCAAAAAAPAPAGCRGAHRPPQPPHHPPLCRPPPPPPTHTRTHTTTAPNPPQEPCQTPTNAFVQNCYLEEDTLLEAYVNRVMLGKGGVGASWSLPTWFTYQSCANAPY